MSKSLQTAGDWEIEEVLGVCMKRKKAIARKKVIPPRIMSTIGRGIFI